MNKLRCTHIGKSVQEREEKYKKFVWRDNQKIFRSTCEEAEDCANAMIGGLRAIVWRSERGGSIAANELIAGVLAVYVCST